MMKKKNIITILCKKCKTETNHVVEWSKLISWSSDDIQGSNEYQVLSCAGCNEITFRIVSENSEDFDFDGKGGIEYLETYKLYPERRQGMIEPIFEMWYAPEKVRNIYQETIDAYNNKQLILCAMGIRAIIEAVCIEEGIKLKNLENKIDELKNKGIINSALCAGLQESRVIGNVSAHKLDGFEEKDLQTAIGLINHLIVSQYSLPRKVKELKEKTSKFKKKIS